MNTHVLVAAEEGAATGRGLEQARALILESEQRFSRFLPDSEVSQLNLQSGHWAGVSGDLFEILALAQHYHALTRGLFDPSVLPDLVGAGYDRSMDLIRAGDVGQAQSSASPWTFAKGDTRSAGGPRPTIANMEFDEAGRRVRMPARMAVDLGGIAKGWIVQRAAVLLNSFCSACAVSAGGDIFFCGLPPHASVWEVELEDPRDPARTLARISTGPGAVVTSSVKKRRWNQNGLLRHHIIDPRTGEPAESMWLSATVMAPQASAAEAYAKALLIGGTEHGAIVGASESTAAFIMVDEDGRLLASEQSRDALDAKVSITYFS